MKRRLQPSKACCTDSNVALPPSSSSSSSSSSSLPSTDETDLQSNEQQQQHEFISPSASSGQPASSSSSSSAESTSSSSSSSDDCEDDEDYVEVTKQQRRRKGSTAADRRTNNRRRSSTNSNTSNKNRRNDVSSSSVANSNSSNSSNNEPNDASAAASTFNSNKKKDRRNVEHEGLNRRTVGSFIQATAEAAGTVEWGAGQVQERKSLILKPLNITDANQSEIFMFVLKGQFDKLISIFSVWQRSYEQQKELVGLHLLNFLLEAGGFPGNFIKFNDAEGKTVRVLLDEAVGTLDMQGFGLTSKFPLISNDRKFSSFSNNFREFWILLASAFEADIYLYSDINTNNSNSCTNSSNNQTQQQQQQQQQYRTTTNTTTTTSIYQNLIVNCIFPLSNHVIRNIRHSGTAAGFAFCEGVIDLYKNATEDCERYQIQLDSSEDRQSVREVLHRKQETRRRLQKRYSDCVTDLSVALNLRWRDRCPLIRKATFESLFRAIEKSPKLVLMDVKKSRFLGYALYDRESSIRLLAIQFLLRASNNNEIFDLLTTQVPNGFLSGFLIRLVELSNDVDLNVRLNGIKFLIKLAEKDLLSDEQVQQTIECLWDYPSLLCIHRNSYEDQSRFLSGEVRSALVQFINITTFSNSVFSDWEESTQTESASNSLKCQSDAMNLRIILEFLVEFGEGSEMLTDILVSALWKHASCMASVGCLMDFLIVVDSNTQREQSLLSDTHKLPLLFLLRSVYQHLDLSATTTAENFSTGVSAETAKKFLNQATVAIFNRSASLIRVCKSEIAMMNVATTVILLATSNADEVKNQINIKDNIKTLCNCFLTSSFLSSIDNLGFAIFKLENIWNEIISLGVLRTVQDHLIQTVIRDALNSLKLIGSNDENENLRSELNLNIRRLLTISKSANFNIYWSDWDLTSLLVELIDFRLLKSNCVDSFTLVASLFSIQLAGFHTTSDIAELDEQLKAMESSTTTGTQILLNQEVNELEAAAETETAETAETATVDAVNDNKKTDNDCCCSSSNSSSGGGVAAAVSSSTAGSSRKRTRPAFTPTSTPEPALKRQTRRQTRPNSVSPSSSSSSSSSASSVSSSSSSSLAPSLALASSSSASSSNSSSDDLSDDHSLICRQIKNTKSEIESKLDKFLTLKASASSKCLELIQNTKSDVLKFVCFTSILEFGRLSVSKLSSLWTQTLFMRKQQQLTLDGDTLSLLSTFVSSCITDFETLALKLKPHELRSICFATDEVPAFPLSFNLKSQTPLIHDLLDGEIAADSDAVVSDSVAAMVAGDWLLGDCSNDHHTDSSEGGERRFDAPVVHAGIIYRFCIWRLIYLFRLLETIDDAFICQSSIIPSFLSLLRFNHPNLNSSVTRYVNSILSLSECDDADNNNDNNNEIFWNMVHNTAQTLISTSNQFPTLRLVLLKISSLLPAKFLYARLTNFINLLVKITEDKKIGEKALVFFTCFVPRSAEYRVKFVEELKRRISTSTTISNSIRLKLLNSFINKIKGAASAVAAVAAAAVGEGENEDDEG